MSIDVSTGTTVALSELLDLRGRTAIVTGAATGIGRRLGARLHMAGCTTGSQIVVDGGRLLA